jgi:hypothetical protein
MMRKFLMLATCLSLTGVVQAQTCAFTSWTTYQKTPLLRHAEIPAYLFSTISVKVDADGAPNAYHPDDVKLHCTKGQGFKGLDCPANGGYPNSSWWRSAILPDPNNNAKPYIQPPSNEFAGYFVSQTTLQDKNKAPTDPTRYVDSRTIPFLVFPGSFHKMAGTGGMGDIGYAVNIENGKGSAFIVAEVGPSTAALGEMSIALGSALGGNNPNPRTGAGTPKGKIVYVVFPGSGSSPKWPVSDTDLKLRAQKLVLSIRGTEALTACAGKL